MPQPLRVTLLIGSALASLCMEVPPRSCRPACVRSTRTDFLRTAAAVVGASSLSLCAQGPAVASPAEERSPALLAFDQMQAAGRGHTCTLPHMCSCAPCMWRQAWCCLTHLHLRRRNSPPGSHPWPGTQPARERGGHLQATQRQDQVDSPRAQAREASQSQRREHVRSLLTSPSLPPFRPACLAGHLARYHLARAAFFTHYTSPHPSPYL